MAVTENSFVGNGSTTNYSFTFPYLKSTDVEVQVDATVTTAWTFANATTVQFNTAPANNAKIKILRQTNVDNLTATFYAGSAIKSEDLNDNYTQNLYKTQEVGNRYFANTGGTMTGDLTLAEDVDLIFEGATDNAHETTLTVADPTADRTITIPDVTGTVVTTGDTATVTATMMAANSVDSSELVDGSVDLSHMSANSVDSDQYVDGSIDLAHMSANSVDSDQYVDGSIDHVHLANDCIDGDNIQDDVINSEHIAAGAIDLEHMASGSVDSDNIVDGTIVNADINASAAIGLSKLATGALPSGITVASANITDGTIVAGDIATDTITASQLAANSVGTSEIADAELVTLAGMQTGTASILAGGTALTATLSEINSVCDGKSSETSVTDDDTKYPTSGAVVDYVSTQLSAVGGFETIATDAAFPNTQPASGIIVSIADAGGLVVNGSGTSTTGRTVGASTVTINNINSQFNSSTVAAGVAMMVESTGSGQIYNYHKATLKEADLINLSTDINDFGNRYRVGTKTADNDASNDDGDLFFDTSANKMYVYDGAYNAGGSWGEVASAGDYKLLGIKDNGQAHNGTGPTFNGSNDQYDLFDGSNDASITNAGQLIVSLNGVIQKPNASYDAAGEGYALDGADGIRFCDPPPAGSSLFITQIGSATTLTTPSDNSISSIKIQNGAVETAKLAADAVDGTRLADNACDSEHYTDGSIDHVHLANDCIDGDNIQDDVVNSEHIAAGAVDLEHMSSESVDEDNLYISNAGTNGQFLSKQSGNDGGLTWADAGSVGGATGVDFNDDVLVRFGTGNDLTLKHTGTYSMIHDNSDDLYIQGDEIHLRSNTNNDQYLKATVDAAVELYHNNVKACETSANGLAMPDGKGIDFAADGQASGMTSELLDDYEEGTFTADLIHQGSTSNTGHYTKIGRLVIANFRLTGLTATGNNNHQAVGGLPFTIKNVTSAGGVARGYQTYDVAVYDCSPNGTAAYMYNSTGGNINAVSLGGKVLTGTIIYITDS